MSATVQTPPSTSLTRRAVDGVRDHILDVTYGNLLNAWWSLPAVRRRDERQRALNRQHTLIGRDLERMDLGLEPKHSEYFRGITAAGWREAAQQGQRTHLRVVRP